MESAAGQQWFLRKHEDGTIFGPLAFDQLAHWAMSAQVAPHDSVSTDQSNWMKAPMLPELGMDWIVEVTSERLYGPTTLGAIREFLRLGEIDETTSLINACDASRMQVRDIAEQLAALPADEAESENEPSASGMSISLEDRIRELEQALREERRGLAELEARYRELEEKHNSLLNLAAASKA
jgi:hypothetical protein